MTNRLLDRIAKWPKPLYRALTFVLVLLVAAVDLSTGDELSFFVFYFIPVSFAAWTLGLRAAVGSALLATIGWLAVETLSGHKYSHPWLLFANTLIRWSSYMLMGYFFVKLKQSRTALARYALELETMVQQRTAKLQERVSELEMFSYSVSHNLRAPLRAIEGMSHLIDDALPENKRQPEISRCLSQIKAAAVRMDRLVMDLVGYVQLTIREPEIRPTFLAPLISEAIETNRQLIETSGARITCTRWEGAVLANSGVLKTVLVELINNAVQFASPERKPVVTVRVDDSSLAYVRIFISDNGIGIAPEHQRRIFGLFEQLHSYDRFGGGTGMGLAVAKKSVEKLGGTIEVHSDGEGYGATFCISLERYQRGPVSRTTNV
ncbi:MAG TPA: ATP-binding protein [Verrucomicrobiae bacterium]